MNSCQDNLRNKPFRANGPFMGHFGTGFSQSETQSLRHPSIPVNGRVEHLALACVYQDIHTLHLYLYELVIVYKGTCSEKMTRSTAY